MKRAQKEVKKRNKKSDKVKKKNKKHGKNLSDVATSPDLQDEGCADGAPGQRRAKKSLLASYIPAGLDLNQRARLHRKLLRVGYCEECQAVRDDRLEHRSRHCLNIRTLRHDEGLAFVDRVVREMQGDPSVRAQRIRAQQKENRKKWRPPQQTQDDEVRFTFGKCKGRTLENAEATWAERNMRGTFDGYLRHCYVSGILRYELALVDALKRAGKWEAMTANAEQERREYGHRLLRRAALQPPLDLAPEVRRLRAYEAARGHANLAADGGDVSDLVLAPPAQRGPKSKRPRLSAATVHMQTCRFCKSCDCKAHACPFASQGAQLLTQEKRCKAGAFARRSAEARLKARLKYSPLEQRIDDRRPKKRARTPIAVSGYEMTQMNAQQFWEYLVSDRCGLLANLEGQPCFKRKCLMGEVTGRYSDDKFLVGLPSRRRQRVTRLVLRPCPINVSVAEALAPLTMVALFMPRLVEGATPSLKRRSLLTFTLRVRRQLLSHGSCELTRRLSRGG